LGEQTCVTGKVLKVIQSKSGSYRLNFCENSSQCPFAVEVFRRDLSRVGNVPELEGKTLEIYGRIQKWHGRAEIILRHASQLNGDLAGAPSLTKGFDVEKRGKYHANQAGKKSQGSTTSQTTSSTTTTPAKTP
jgi:DNA/RNA endonuclease YhcR with UshA esterase domain